MLCIIIIVTFTTSLYIENKFSSNLIDFLLIRFEFNRAQACYLVFIKCTFLTISLLTGHLIRYIQHAGHLVGEQLLSIARVLLRTINPPPPYPSLNKKCGSMEA